ncbi:hypothetical protein Sliba_59800 [Streptomyces nigrescens]|uniref:Uncharacterized protein n=1 Tax=Streptomyces nigrescens TaxID=1920 RepID=A0A640TPC8_STRNI|nr:hypothetical protein Sliba_59800 [Streptomyces libani subsp. libani]GGV98276.1 hypothetical protein GCM10010500_46560 [Streptomyces libani subsp. libani]
MCRGGGTVAVTGRHAGMRQLRAALCNCSWPKCGRAGVDEVVVNVSGVYSEHGHPDAVQDLQDILAAGGMPPAGSRSRSRSRRTVRCGCTGAPRCRPAVRREETHHGAR